MFLRLYRYASGDHGINPGCCRLGRSCFNPDPTRPSPHDLRAVGHTVELATGEKRPFAFVVTQAKPNSCLTIQAVTSLSEHGIVAPSIIHDRVDFASSMIDGRTVLEISGQSRSAEEAAELWQFMKARMHASNKKR